MHPAAAATTKTTTTTARIITWVIARENAVKWRARAAARSQRIQIQLKARKLKKVTQQKLCKYFVKFLNCLTTEEKMCASLKKACSYLLCTFNFVLSTHLFVNYVCEHVCVACAATWLSRNCVIHIFCINGIYFVFAYAYHDYKGTHCMWGHKCVPRRKIQRDSLQFRWVQRQY